MRNIFPLPNCGDFDGFGESVCFWETLFLNFISVLWFYMHFFESESSSESSSNRQPSSTSTFMLGITSSLFSFRLGCVCILNLLNSSSKSLVPDKVPILGLLRSSAFKWLRSCYRLLMSRLIFWRIEAISKDYVKVFSFLGFNSPIIDLIPFGDTIVEWSLLFSKSFCTFMVVFLIRFLFDPCW